MLRRKRASGPKQSGAKQSSVLAFLGRHSEGSLTAGVMVALIAATIVLFVAVPRLTAVASAWEVDCSEVRCLAM